MEVGSERFLGYKATVFVTAVVLALLAYALVRHTPDAAPEMAAQDVLARLAPRPARPDVVVVALDDASVKRYGPIKTWPRGLLAQGLHHVEDAGAKVVVLDMDLTRRQGSDEALWRTMASQTPRNVVLGMAYDEERMQSFTPDDIRALVFLERDAIADKLTLSANTAQFTYWDFEPPVSDFTGSAAGVGVFDRETDADGILRDARMFYMSAVHYPPTTKPLPGKFPQSNLADGAPAALPNLALVAALRVFQLDKSNVQVVSGDTLHLAGAISPSVNVPIDEQGRARIRYAAPGPVTYSFADIATGKAKPDMKGKVVLIGATATNDPATDLCATPLGRLPRVDVTANALTTLLDRSYVEVVDRHPTHLLGTLLIVGLVTGLSLMFVSGGRAAALALFLLLVYGGVCYGAYSSGHGLFPLLPGFLTILLTYLISLALSLGPFRREKIGASPTYVPPPS